MGATAILSIVLTALDTLVKVAPQVVQTVGDLKPYAEQLYRNLTGQEATDEQRAAMAAGIEALFARMETPLPPAQPGDPDYKADA